MFRYLDLYFIRCFCDYVIFQNAEVVLNEVFCLCSAPNHNRQEFLGHWFACVFLEHWFACVTHTPLYMQSKTSRLKSIFNSYEYYVDWQHVLSMSLWLFTYLLLAKDKEGISLLASVWKKSWWTVVVVVSDMWCLISPDERRENYSTGKRKWNDFSTSTCNYVLGWCVASNLFSFFFYRKRVIIYKIGR